MRREAPADRAAAAVGRLRNRKTPARRSGQEKPARESGSARYAARVQYDGTDFAGFQAQPGKRTVQGEIEATLVRLNGGSRIRVDGAGRTDAGVHARGQVIAFTYGGRLRREELLLALSSLLPPDIGLGPLRKVDRGFHPRYRAKWREYRYFIWNGPPSPLRERYAVGVRENLDVGAMAATAEVFVGRHDFSAFAGHDRQPVRTLNRVAVRKAGSVITIEVVGDAFMRQMVRRIAAALMRVGRGAATHEEVAAALREVRRPAFSGETAPAHGLVLWRVPMTYEQTTRTNENDEQDI
ncbi:MAG: tRNA pseudouridine(38-40) synthase TruA [Candidatus Limnocylindrales bacterium]